MKYPSKVKLSALLLLHIHTLLAFSLFTFENNQDDGKEDHQEKVYAKTLSMYVTLSYTCVGISSLLCYISCNAKSRVTLFKGVAIVVLHTILGLLLSWLIRYLTPIPDNFLAFDLKPRIYPYKVAYLLSLLFINIWISIAGSLKKYVYAVLAGVFIFALLEFIIFVFKYNQMRIMKALQEKEEIIMKLSEYIDELEIGIRDMRISTDVGEGVYGIIRGARSLLDTALGRRRTRRRRTSSWFF